MLTDLLPPTTVHLTTCVKFVVLAGVGRYLGKSLEPKEQGMGYGNSWLKCGQEIGILGLFYKENPSLKLGMEFAYPEVRKAHPKLQ